MWGGQLNPYVKERRGIAAEPKVLLCELSQSVRRHGLRTRRSSSTPSVYTRNRPFSLLRLVLIPTMFAP